MEKLSRMEKYKELRETIDSDTAAVGKPSINSVELQKQLRSLNEPQESGETSRHSRQTPRFSKEIDLQQNDDADEGPDQFHNEYLDDFINDDTMQYLNYRVVELGEDRAQVARDFLLENGLVTEEELGI